MSDHTPGPWVIRNPDDLHKCKGIVGADGQGLAYTVGLRDPRDTLNAQLIAAAPSLLEALIYARRFLDNRTTDCDFIDAAIKKAKGEA